MTALVKFARLAGPLGIGVLVVGIAAGVLMLIAEFTPLFSVEVVTASCSDLARPELRDTCETTGGEQHSYALLLIALLTVAMAFGAGPGHSRPAAAALVVAGGAVLIIAIFGDMPDSDQTGAIGSNFDQAHSVREPGLYLEMLGGVLAILAGVLRLSPLGRPPPPEEPRERDRPRRPERKPPERPQRERKRPRPADA